MNTQYLTCGRVIVLMELAQSSRRGGWAIEYERASTVTVNLDQVVWEHGRMAPAMQEVSTNIVGWNPRQLWVPDLDERMRNAAPRQRGIAAALPELEA